MGPNWPHGKRGQCQASSTNSDPEIPSFSHLPADSSSCGCPGQEPRPGMRPGPWDSLRPRGTVYGKQSSGAPPPMHSGSKSSHHESKSLGVQADFLPGCLGKPSLPSQRAAQWGLSLVLQRRELKFETKVCAKSRNPESGMCREGGRVQGLLDGLGRYPRHTDPDGTLRQGTLGEGPLC